MPAPLPVHFQHSLDGHEGSVLSVRFTGRAFLAVATGWRPAADPRRPGRADDGAYCLSGGRDKVVRLWNPHTGLLIKAYKGHGFEINDAVACVGAVAAGSSLPRPGLVFRPTAVL